MRRIPIGGDSRIGSGKKMDVTLHGYERSTHDLSYTWKNTQAAGTIVPFLVELALPADTHDIELDISVMTHPTVGPLFGSFKVQADIYSAAIRLYQGLLHNDTLKIGMTMADVKLPLIDMYAEWTEGNTDANHQINPSCIFKYLGISGLGRKTDGTTGTVRRKFNGIPFIMYWDTVKNYYANKQEEIGYVIHFAPEELVDTVQSVSVSNPAGTITQYPVQTPIDIRRGMNVAVFCGMGGPVTPANQIILGTTQGEFIFENIFNSTGIDVVNGYLVGIGITLNSGNGENILYWRYRTPDDLVDTEPKLVPYNLESIDGLRENILTTTGNTSAFTITEATQAPFGLPLTTVDGYYSQLASQEGLAVKTYQSDLFNNWLNKEWIDGSNGINEISAVSTVGDSFTIDALNLKQKVYNMLNRIAVSGGSYLDYLEASYDHDQYRRSITPVYEGGLSKELVFQQVVSNAATAEQPLGTLGGKGVMSGKHKGGKVIVKTTEPSYIMGLISITPRVCYSQGNKWDVNLQTMADLHVPALDGIGYQDLIADQMHWSSTTIDGQGATPVMVMQSVGKTVAWINYMTNVDVVRGNFAIPNNEGFMVLDRRYELDENGELLDATTYIDPVKFNQIFAQTSRDSMNYWVEVGVKMIKRGKISAKQIPNL